MRLGDQLLQTMTDPFGAVTIRLGMFEPDISVDDMFADIMRQLIASPIVDASTSIRVLVTVHRPLSTNSAWSSYNIVEGATSQSRRLCCQGWGQSPHVIQTLEHHLWMCVWSDLMYFWMHLWNDLMHVWNDFRVTRCMCWMKIELDPVSRHRGDWNVLR